MTRATFTAVFAACFVAACSQEENCDAALRAALSIAASDAIKKMEKTTLPATLRISILIVCRFVRSSNFTIINSLQTLQFLGAPEECCSDKS